MLLPSAITGLLGGNILAVFPFEDLFGNLDESREQIVSLILITNTTRVIWLPNYSHLHIRHCFALSSGANPPMAVL